MKKVFQIAATSTVIFFVFEVGCRLYHFSKIQAPYRPRGLAAVRLFISGGSFICEFRGQSYLFKKPDDVFRILAIGGSTTAGTGPDTKTWPYHLAERLNHRRDGKKYEVINLGQSGASSAQEYYNLLNHFYLNPDLVLLYDGYNDLTQANARPAEYLVNTVRTYNQMERQGFERFKFFLYRHLAIVNRLHVYLYRLQAALNGLILERKLFGVRQGRGFRVFEKAEWYRRQLDWESKTGTQVEQQSLLTKVTGNSSPAAETLVRTIFADNNPMEI